MTVKAHKSKPIKGTISLAALLIAFAAVGTTGGLVLSDRSGVSLDTETVTIDIAQGASASSVAAQLKESGVIKYPSVFKLMARSDNYASAIKPGAATINNGMSYKEILELLCSDNRDTNKLTIPEGFEQKQIAERLESEGFCTQDEFEAATHDDYGYDFLNGLPDRPYRLEGYLYPDTYIIPEGASAHDIIDMMLSEFNDNFTAEYSEQAKSIADKYGFTNPIDSVITMASIIERETDSDTERAKVAGVFYNRLDQKMNLQSCATVQYVLGERKSVLSIADTQTDSPYNTYKYSGLPEGPIANPGLDCIKAALYPEATDYLYFVMGTDGQHIFSKTYEEHLAAMNSTESAVRVDGGQQ